MASPSRRATGTGPDGWDEAEARRQADAPATCTIRRRPHRSAQSSAGTRGTADRSAQRVLRPEEAAGPQRRSKVGPQSSPETTPSSWWRSSPPRRINSVGGLRRDGVRWRATRAHQPSARIRTLMPMRSSVVVPSPGCSAGANCRLTSAEHFPTD
jgi:hypothetical protein